MVVERLFGLWGEWLYESWFAQSHLDCGATFVGAWTGGATRVYALGARDYFFSNPLLAWFVTTCMHVIPINRRKFSQQESLRQPAAPTAPQQCSSSPPCSPCPTLSSCFSLLPPPSHSRLHHQLDTLLELKVTSGPHRHTAVLIYPSLLSLLYPFPLFLSSSLPPTTSSTPYCSSRQPAVPTAPQQCSSSPPCSQYHNISHFSLSSLVPPLHLSPSHHQLDTLLQLKATSGPHRPTAVLIFPEGTRSITGSLQPFKSGVGLLAEQLDVPVVPVCVKSGVGLLAEQLDVPVVPVCVQSGVGLLAEQLDVPMVRVCVQGTFEALPKGRSIPLRRRVTVEFGRPLDVQEYLQVAQVAPPDAAVVSPPASTQGDAVQSTSAPGPTASEDTERAMRRAAHRRFADDLQSSVADMAARSKGRGAQGETGSRSKGRITLGEAETESKRQLKGQGKRVMEGARERQWVVLTACTAAAAVAAASFGGVSPQGISQASYAAAASLLACVPVQPGETAGLAAALALCFALLIAGFRPVASWVWPYLFFPSDDQEEMP
ncbi:unnamed protein product [Closterium sp. Naga37s-1]|nr:unnamed protein product [Closterium sp. Naga37s-1]